MGFLVFVVLMLPAVLLYGLVQAALRPFAGVLGPVLALLNDRVVFYGVAKALLVWNVLVLAALVAVRHQWKRAGRLEPGYIRSAGGWRRLWRWLTVGVLTLGPVWEAVLVLFFALVLAFQLGGPLP